MTTEVTPNEASQDNDDIEALFTEAAGGAAAAASEEQAETTEQPEQKPTAQEDGEVSESDLDLSQNAVKTEASEEEASAEKKTEEAAKPADWRATLTPEVKAEIEKIEAQNNRLAHQARSDAGRVAALTKRVDELARLAKQGSSAAAKEREALLQKFAANYPEIAEAMKAQLEGTKAELESTKQLAAALAQKHEQDATVEREAAVEAAHPGWKTAIKEPAFAEWYGAQPSEVKALGASDEPGAAIALLNAYRASHPATSKSAETTETTQQTTTRASASKTAAEIKAERAKTLAASAGVQTRAASRDSTTSGPSDDVDGAFEFFSKQKTKARR